MDKNSFGLDIWGENNFFIDDDTININYGSKPSLLELTSQIREKGHRGPLIFRFPHILQKQIERLFNEFNQARLELDYKSPFRAVFPLKVNQLPNFVNSIVSVSSKYNYGLEAGSKAELIIAMSYTRLGEPITINGFKDKELISLCFIAGSMGHNITIIIEGINELNTILEVSREFKSFTPKIGMRIRLHSSGSGIWAKSGGYASKFGMSATELLEAYDILKANSLLDKFYMIHFHIGSQMGQISPLKKALREAGNLYAQLHKMGATTLNAINIGGGLAVEYSQHSHIRDVNYSIREFANDVVFSMSEIAKNSGVVQPEIFIESGRFIASSHSVLIAPVLELFSQEYNQKTLRLKDKNPPLVQELYELYTSMTKEVAREYLHDGLDHLESLLTLFDLGYIDIIDRSNSEILVDLIIKKAISLLKDENIEELRILEDRIDEKYLVNLSLFQSIPDYWGLKQNFPIVPLSHLDKVATRSATICDISCDSDGEIPYNHNIPLHLHDIDLSKEEYFLGFFLTGAYQEILGMKHNLFTHPTEIIVNFDNNGDYSFENIIESQNLMDILEDIDYKRSSIDKSLKNRIDNIKNLNSKEKDKLLGKLYLYLSQNGYLRAY
ncbi:Arginine decarboxylase [hydrothermal vent metagenome]|uniref:arginine decarboxylase n=1 Tax=hydrothermal vent metagenome TaxID=652676 RepID=A0A1W1ELH3_9ZZZZ